MVYATQTWMRVRGARLLHVAVRATAMASTMSKAAIAARTTAGYAPEQQRSTTLISTQTGLRVGMWCCTHVIQHRCVPVRYRTSWQQT